MAMSIADVQTETPKTGNRYVIHGVGGVGKSTFGIEAATAEGNKGIFIMGEDGAAKLPLFHEKKIPHFPIITTSKDNEGRIEFGWNKFTQALVSLYKEEHDFNVLVVDTLDSFNPMMEEYVVATYYNGDAKAADAYKNKYNDFMREMNKLTSMLTLLSSKRDIDIYLLIHSIPENHKDPASENWKRWELNLPGGDKTNLSRLIYDWCDACLFSNFDVSVSREGKGKGNRRVAYTEWDAAYEAKNRFNMPSVIPFNYEEFSKHIKKESK